MLAVRRHAECMCYFYKQLTLIQNLKVKESSGLQCMPQILFGMLTFSNTLCFKGEWITLNWGMQKYFKTCRVQLSTVLAGMTEMFPVTLLCVCPRIRTRAIVSITDAAPEWPWAPARQWAASGREEGKAAAVSEGEQKQFSLLCICLTDGCLKILYLFKI